MKQHRYIPIQRICWVVVAFLFFLLSGMPGLARNNPFQFPLDRQQQQPSELEEPVTPTPNAPGLSDPQELEAFVDNFINRQTSKSHTPGAVVSVVKDGKLFFAKGYGYANLEKNIPVVADKTLFRVASLSKLFTATAAMQLYERGLLELEAPINNYLTEFQLENPFPEPARVAQLMTHTDGTTRRRIGLAARTAAAMEPLENYLADHMPSVVWPPGELYSYSSHSTALLGYLVQKISGIPFPEYIDQNILQPLEMKHSTFLQPPPPALADDLAVGYQYQGGNFKSVPYLYLNIAPAASLQATATDMAHFMIAHLQLGRYKNGRILEPDTARLMHQQHFTHHPQLPGTAYSFHERLENNIRALEHLGSLRGYSSSLTLLPDRNIGIFIATNDFSGLPGRLVSQFFDRYFPVQKKPAPPKPLALSEDQLNRLTGTYWDVEYPRHTFAKLSAPFKQININKGTDGTLLISSPNLFFMGSGPTIKLIPVGPLLFQHANDESFTAFGEDERGRVRFVFNPLWPIIGAYERIHWYESIWIQLGLVGFCLVLFLSAVIIWPGGYLIRRVRKRHWQSSRFVRIAWTVAGLIGILYLTFLISVPLLLWLIGVWKLVYGVPAVVVPFFYLPPVAVVLTIALPIFTLLAWKNKFWSLLNRIHYSLVMLAAIALIPLLLYWNLLGLQF